MSRTSVFFISLLIFLPPTGLLAQDTIRFPLKIRAGFDVSGPAIYFSDKTNMNLEGFISYDRNEKSALSLTAGYLDYKYSQYNYNYLCKGFFMRAGIDFNLLKPKVSAGRYRAGIGLHYGLSLFTPETPSFTYGNYWGDVSSAIAQKTSLGHFIEIAPGVETELFKYLSIGWTIRLKMLVSGGGGKDLRPIYFPGYGDGSKTINTGFSYYITINIPFRKITVITKPETQEEPEEPEEATVNPQGGTGIR